MSDKIKPCPFCGGDDIITSDNVEVWGQESDQVYARCNKCGANGPSAYTDPNAIAKWNTRPALAQPQNDAEAEPVAWQWMVHGDWITIDKRVAEDPEAYARSMSKVVRPIYTAPPSHERMREALPDDIRADGWSVAVHNDYRINGERNTFWLFTKAGRAIKGEGQTDADALNAVREALRADDNHASDGNNRDFSKVQIDKNGWFSWPKEASDGKSKLVECPCCRTLQVSSRFSNAPSDPTPPDATAQREEIAAFLLARDEDEFNPERFMDWARNLIEAGKREKHSGDCTKESHSCVVCGANTALANADRILALQTRAGG